jgi:hypothetical protein
VVARAQVKITAAKGRPMLTWVGKRPLSHLPAFPSQLVERFEAATAPDPAAWKDWPAKYPKGGLLFHGDNKEVLAHLLANGFRGKVQLIYIDPPFDSGADYVRRVGLRGPTGSTKIAGESYTLGEQIQYTDIWANDSYLQFMYERLLLLNELLSSEGTLYLHCGSARPLEAILVLSTTFTIPFSSSQRQNASRSTIFGFRILKTMWTATLRWSILQPVGSSRALISRLVVCETEKQERSGEDLTPARRVTTGSNRQCCSMI